MPTELHATICQLIDKSLAGGATTAEERSIREHIATCAVCGGYLEANNRAIAGLGGFRFEIDPTLETRVFALLAASARQLEAKRSERSRVREWSWVAAVSLTIAGSFAALQLGGVAAPILHIGSTQWRMGLTTFWILPSFFVCLLILLLPAATSARVREKGISL